MIKIIRTSPLLLGVVTLLLATISSFIAPTVVEAARCYIPEAVYEGGVQTDETRVARLTPGCTYQNWSNAGLDVDGLPNPFPAGDSTCYFFPINESGGSARVVNCADPQYANAPEAYQNVSDPSDGIIGNDTEAQQFCDAEGDVLTSLGADERICYFTNPTSQTQCNNLHLDNPAVCVPLPLSSMIGKTEQEVRSAVTAAIAASTPSARIQDNPIITKVLKPIITTLTALVGLVVVISLIIAGIQYSAARDNAQMVAAAKMRILMSILALVIFIFGFAVLQWLVPGGVL